MQNGLKKLLRLIIVVAALFLGVRWCSKNFGNVINLPGGLGKESTGDSGGWFSPKEQNGGSSTNRDLELDVEDLERELGIGKYKGQAPANNTPSTNNPGTTYSSSTPLTFKGIPMTGSLSAFGSELVKAGFRNAGNGTFTGDFAGYSGCKVTPSGNPVREVRVDFPVISDWNALENAYDALQTSLTQKYGFEPKANPATSNVAIYDLPNGTITLDADVSNQSTWHVILKYTNGLSVASTGNLGRNPIDDL